MINSREEWFLTTLMKLQIVAITEREVYKVKLKYSKHSQIPAFGGVFRGVANLNNASSKASAINCNNLL